MVIPDDRVSSPFAGPKIDSHIPIVGRVAVAATAFIVWDTIIHLADEVEYIWRGPRLWTTWCYAFVRHVPYLVQGTILYLTNTVSSGKTFSYEQCRGWIIYQFASVEAIIVVVELILIARVFAMYHGNRAIRVVTLAFYCMEIIGMTGILVVTVPNMGFSNTCDVTSMPRVFACYWIFSLCFETFLFTLTLFKFFRSAACYLHDRSLLLMLVRDGTWAYTAIFAVMLTNTLMYQVVKNSLAGVFFFCEISVVSFAGSHVLLNLRRLAKQSPELKVSSGMTTQTIRFSSHVPVDPACDSEEATQVQSTVVASSMQEISWTCIGDCDMRDVTSSV
ncbi:hypothetical protein CERSUDRAFT_125397 [Gelatoporia subvermispora B]|uniref:DUF6533 domain-containing protein n=1 Tax=Ceriporiopsis subvermispora (strain B) TaxID=914234 RepID=M2R865_CERS8|nr:hypothetical protein CERSUDRAFT_125397 [Gelatoporia subvermispora B]